MSENTLHIAEGDSLVIQDGDHFSVGGGASVPGSISGEGTLGLNWNGYTSAESLANILCEILEENIPTLTLDAEVSSRTLVISTADIGAESYYASLDGGEPQEIPPDNLEIRFGGLEPASSHTVELTAVNSRGNTLSDEWEVTLGSFYTVYEVNQDLYAQPNQTHGANAVFMARIVDKETGVYLTDNDVETITLNAWKYRRNETGVAKESVQGFIDVDVPIDSVQAAPTHTDFWNLDEGKVNFIHVPDQRGEWLFPTPGAYLIEYSMTLKNGNPVNLHYEFNVF